MIGEIIKNQRELHNITQVELARKLGISRVAVNNWEMGISEPSLRHIVRLASIFSVSADFLLETGQNEAIGCEGLTPRDKDFLYQTIEYMRNKNKEPNE